MTFREMLVEFLKNDPDRFTEQRPEPGDHKKYELDPKLASTIYVFTAGASEVAFDFDAEGNLLNLDTYILDDVEALREVAGDIEDHPALDHTHLDTLLCTADHLEEWEAQQAAPKKVEEPPKKQYLN